MHLKGIYSIYIYNKALVVNSDFVHTRETEHPVAAQSKSQVPPVPVWP